MRNHTYYYYHITLNKLIVPVLSILAHIRTKPAQENTKQLCVTTQDI